MILENGGNGKQEIDTWIDQDMPYERDTNGGYHPSELFRYHLKECVERYKELIDRINRLEQSVEKRMNRVEMGMWMALIGLLGTLTTVIIEIITHGHGI